jgi:RNA polymerase sigma-70 factor, ECF subfamily
LEPSFTLAADEGAAVREPVDQTIQLIRQARSGSNDALGRLLDGCRRYLLQIAADDLDPRLRAKGGASDIVQETFLEAQRDFSEFMGESEPELLAWLRNRLHYRVTKFARTFRGTAKREVGREVPLDGDSSRACLNPAADQPSPSENILRDECDHALERAMERLPEEYRRVIQLRYREGQSFEQIGESLARSPNSARKLWARAIERLKRDLRTTTSA